jgi:hypothetical protein
MHEARAQEYHLRSFFFARRALKTARDLRVCETPQRGMS